MEFSAKREALLDAATDLFERQCFHGTGVDQIAREAGVTKRTLYQQFGSKEGLVCAVLDRAHEQMLADMLSMLDAVGDDPSVRLVRCIEWMLDGILSCGETGCLQVKALGEYGGDCAGVVALAQGAKRAWSEHLCVLLEAADFERAGVLAGQIQLVVEGARVLVLSGESPHAAVELARTLIQQLGVLPW